MRPETPRATPATTKEKRKATPEEVAALLATVNALFPLERTAQVREGVLRVPADAPDALHGTRHDWDADENGGVLVPQTFLRSPELDLRMGSSAPVASDSRVVTERRQQERGDDTRWERLTVAVRDVSIAFARYRTTDPWGLQWDDLASASVVRFARLLACVEWEDESSLPVKFRRAVGRGAHKGHEPTSADMPADVAWRALRALARAGLEPVVLAAIEAAAKEE